MLPKINSESYALLNPLNWLDKLAKYSQRRVEQFGAQYRTFSVFTLVNYPVGFIVLYFLESQINESLWLRLIACLLCMPLLFNGKFPPRIRYYLPLYWHVLILYSIPFFATIMLLRNSFSLEWLLNMIIGFFMFILLVDWLTFLVLLILGAALGTVFFKLTGGSFTYIFNNPKLDLSVHLVLYLYFYAIVTGALLARNKEKLNEVKLEALKSLAYSIAHEMRTPLASITAGAGNLKKFLVIFSEVYVKAAQSGLVKQEISNKQINHILDIPIVMEKVSCNAQNIIDMLLMKMREKEMLELDQFSISHCIRTAMSQYPLREEELKSIRWDDSKDFIFSGKEEMFLHIFFNLLKNSLYQIRYVENGAIDIWVESTNLQNHLHFKDNGPGISKRMLAQIFNRFVSGTEFGTGMGLAYCKMAMNSFGGDIECISSEGKGAEFILIFPKILPSHSLFRAHSGALFGDC